MRWHLALFSLVAGCGSPAPPPIAPAPVASSQPPQPIEPVVRDNPRVVRCGVDDAPRPISLAPPSLDEAPSQRLAKKAPPPDFEAGPKPSPAPPATPTPLPFRPPPPPESDMPAVEPSARVIVEQDAPRVGGAPVPPSVFPPLRGASGPEVCEGLFAQNDEGRALLELQMSSSGAPVEVRVTQMPSRYLRCVMERACQARASSQLASQSVFLPLRFRTAPPPGPPDPVPPRPDPRPPVPAEIRALVQQDGPHGALGARLEGVVAAAASSCSGGMVLPRRAQVTFHLSLSSNRRGARDVDGPELGLRMMPMDMVTISGVSTTGLSDQRPLLGCMAQQLMGRNVAGRRLGPAAPPPRISVSVTFNP